MSYRELCVWVHEGVSDGLMESLPVLTGYQISTRKLKKMTHTFMANLGGERGWSMAGGLG